MVFCLHAQGQVPVFKIQQPKPFSFPRAEGYNPFPRPEVTNPLAQTAVVFNPGLTEQAQYKAIMNEVDNYNNQRAYRDQLVAESVTELSKDDIVYDFDLAPSSKTQHYRNAFEEIKKMVEGKTALNLKQAVFLVEHSYDTTLRYEDFNRQISDAISVVSAKMKKSKAKASDNTAKVVALFQYMSDTITVTSAALERKITSYPKTYDFEDFWGRQDYRKMFVSKTLKTGSGQCHSLPLLFLILCEEIGAEASLSFAPNHSFIKFKDKRGVWHNLELTNGMLASDNFIVQSGYIKAEALQSRIFLEPLSKRQTIIQCLNDLALGYVKQFGYDGFVKSITNVVLSQSPSNLTAHQINANYFATLSDRIIYQYRKKGWNRQRLEQDEKAMYVINSAIGATKHIEQLGYSDMPADAYEAWLRSIQAEANRQQHLREIRGLNGMIYTK